MIKTLTVTDRRLQNLKLQYDNKSLFSDKMIGKASHIWANPSYADDDKPLQVIAVGIKNAVDSVRFFTYAMAGLISSEVEMKKRKKQLLEATGCQEDELAIDINEFLRLKEKTTYYGEEFTYNAGIEKSSMRNIQTIFGNAHLEALDEMSCLSNLKSVWGNVHFSRCTNLSGLRLQVVGGNVYGEKLETPIGLDELMYVGGTIFYQDKAYTLEQFQSEVLSTLNMQNNVK